MRSSPTPYLAIWLTINILQSFFTELFHDEAYYWLFSQHLAWGYKDHPPAVAVFIWLGWQLFENELGVRLLMSLLSTASLWLAWKIVQPKDVRFFFLVVFSILIVNIGGFMAAPDVPLLFFTTLFLYFLKKYLAEQSWANALLLGVALTGMAYSKYHGALVLLFILLPNWRLLMKAQTWLIPLVVLALFVPHLYWQYANDYPSLRYHLQDRGEDKYSWTFITDYLAGQLAIWGPLVSIPLFIAAAKRKSRDQFEKTMKWVFWGVFGFFFYQSFQQRTEANWTASAFLPFIFLAMRQLEDQPVLKKWTLRLSWASLVLIIIFRLYLAWNFLPKGVNPRNEFHEWDKWAEEISEITGDRPAVFFNRYQKPVKYLFYSRKPAHTQTVNFDTGTQFDLITFSEEAVQGKDVMIVTEDRMMWEDMDSIVTLKTSGKQIGYRKFDNFKSYNRLRVTALHDEDLEFSPGDEVELPVEILNPTEKEVTIDITGQRAAQLDYMLIQYENIISQGWTGLTLQDNVLSPGEKIFGTVTFTAPSEPGRYRFRFGFHVNELYIGRNSRFYEVVVE